MTSTALELVERDAYTTFFAAAPAGVGAAVRAVSDACCISLRGVGTTMLNRVCGLGVEEPASEVELDEIDEFFGETPYAVAASPHAPGLANLLRPRGFAPAYAWMKFSRGIEAPPPVTTELRVREIDASRGADFGRVITAAFGLPLADEWWPALVDSVGWHCFVAYAGGEPAAAGALFASGRTGWLGIAGTVPDFRRRGGQGAIMAARIAKARELGLELLATETGERVDGRPSNSYRNILRYGFEEEYVRPNYERPGQS